MMAARPQLISVLLEPSIAGALALREWSRLIAQARAANVIGLLGERLHGTEVAPPAGAARQLAAARQLSERQRRSVVWEAHCLQRIFEALPEPVPVVLLKGAAYVIAANPVSQGRLFGDVDILVPRPALGQVEIALMRNGWTSSNHSAYDQRYYRRWMHELPPMVNVRRGTVIDVHHTILPLTSRNSPDAQRIIRRSSPAPGLPGIRIPCPEDLVIHSITHLVHEGELHNGLRDLFDIDGLLRTFGGQDGFWTNLAAFAREHDLAGPVHLGLHLVRCLIGTDVPAAILNELAASAAERRRLPLLEGLYRRALSPDGSGGSPSTAAAQLALYVRAHWLRMPPLLLFRHLGYKAFIHLSRSDASPPARA